MKFSFVELEILMFPCNQFMGMPQKDALSIENFINEEKIDFARVFSSINVNGPDTHPVYQFLKKQCPGIIGWNFVKFMVCKNKNIVKFNHFIVFQAIQNELKMII